MFFLSLFAGTELFMNSVKVGIGAIVCSNN